MGQKRVRKRIWQRWKRKEKGKTLTKLNQWKRMKTDKPGCGRSRPSEWMAALEDHAGKKFNVGADRRQQTQLMLQRKNWELQEKFRNSYQMQQVLLDVIAQNAQQAAKRKSSGI